MDHPPLLPGPEDGRAEVTDLAPGPPRPMMADDVATGGPSSDDAPLTLAQPPALALGAATTTTTTTAPLSYVFTNHKAGMDAVDFDRVKRAVYEASVGSAHFKNEQRKEADLAARLDKLTARASRLSAAEVATATASTSGRVAELIATRDRGRIWCVVDMDAFFAAVEEKDDPALAGAPFAVGSTSMISTASYAARAHGIRSAMPGFVALKLLPTLRFVPPRFDRYVAEAASVRAVLARFDPAFHPAGLDEAYLNLTSYCAEHGKDGLAAAHDVRAAIRAATGLAASAGVAPNRMLAKVAADFGKPDGAFAVPSADPAALGAWIASLPCRKVPGIGRVAERTLASLGVRTCGDLHAARGLVALLFSRASADFFLAAGLGAGCDEEGGGGGGEGEPAAPSDTRRGMSAERTFAPTRHRGELEARVRSLSARLAAGCAAEGLAPRTLTLKLKLASFEVRSRATGLSGGAVAAAVAAAAAVREGGGGGGEGAATAGGEEAPAAPQMTTSSAADRAQDEIEGEADDPARPTPPAVAALAASLEVAALRLLRAEPVCDVRLVGLRLSNWAPPPTRARPPGQRALDDLLQAGGGGEAAPPSRQASPPAEGGPSSSKAATAPTTWTCGLCTFAGTPAHSLRCEVCDGRRGAREAGDVINGGGAASGGRELPARKKAKGSGGGRTAPLAAWFRRRGG